MQTQNPTQIEVSQLQGQLRKERLLRQQAERHIDLLDDAIKNLRTSLDAARAEIHNLRARVKQ